MFSIFEKKYSLNDLEKIYDRINLDRSRFTIALIDDNVFPIVEELRRHSFNVTTFYDIDNIESLKSFHIVISDIKGVGRRLGSKFEGAHLIEEIHKKFPTKYLIAYSSSTFNPTFNDFFRLCDVTKRKNIDMQEWVKTLDEGISAVSNPIYQWEKTRKILLNNKFPIEDVSKIEKGFIKSLVKKNGKFLIGELKQITIADSPITKIAIESITTFAATFISEIIKS